ncbi:MAG: hypothetical protein LBC55_07645, partial [Desulfovibrio sp.]|nr:hypothetical protein [Desulfovibrio sp.]
LREHWECPATLRRIYGVLVVVFIGSACAIVLNAWGLLPEPYARAVPRSPFDAIRMAFSLILVVEVLELIFTVADSVSKAMGKQLEIMALLLLRESFTDISLLNAGASLDQDPLLLAQIGVTAVSGLLLFAFRGIFRRLHTPYGHSNIRGYVCAKKYISLFLLLTFILGGAYDLGRMAVTGEKTVFFHIFYTVLIFTDILLVLAGQYYMPSFQATFRNSGYAVSTLLMRMSMGAQHLTGALLCVLAGLYLLGLAWTISRFADVCPEDAERQSRQR